MVNVSIVIHDNIFPSVQDIRYDYSTQCWIARTLESWQKDFSDLRNIIDLLGKKTLHFSNCRNWGKYQYFTNSKSVFFNLWFAESTIHEEWLYCFVWFCFICLHKWFLRLSQYSSGMADFAEFDVSLWVVWGVIWTNIVKLCRKYR